MNINVVAAAALAIALVAPSFAQDKGTTEQPKDVAPKAQKNAPSKRHSHMEDRQGIKSTDPSAGESKPADPSKHSHPKDR